MQTTKIIYPFGATFLDYPDNISLSAIIYFLGCEHNCKGCHNPTFKLRDYDKAIEVTTEKFYKDLFEFCNIHKTNKVTFSGGDPLYSLNRKFVKEFILKYGNIFDICIYTGYSIEQVKLMNLNGFKFIKVGNYDETQSQEPSQSDNFMKLASRNQEIYNENFSLLTRNGVLQF